MAPSGLKEYSLLTQGECSEISRNVLEMMPMWRKLRWPKSRGRAPFYILGYAAYSCRKSRAGYTRGYRSLNPVLKKQFSWLYERVASVLEKSIGEPVRFRKDASLPGFHILLNHPAFINLPGHWHVDLDATLLKWPLPLDLSQVVAFTLPICLPSSGGTLEFLDLHYDDVSDLPMRSWNAKIKKARRLKSYTYRAGKVVIQDGKRFHRIGNLKALGTPGEMRITLQGFVVRQGKHWEIYW